MGKIYTILYYISLENLTKMYFNLEVENMISVVGKTNTVVTNCTTQVRDSGSIVKVDEIIILIIVFSLWVWAICLFIHR